MCACVHDIARARAFFNIRGPGVEGNGSRQSRLNTRGESRRRNVETSFNPKNALSASSTGCNTVYRTNATTMTWDRWVRLLNALIGRRRLFDSRIKKWPDQLLVCNIIHFNRTALCVNNFSGGRRCCDTFYAIRRRPALYIKYRFWIVRRTVFDEISILYISIRVRNGNECVFITTTLRLYSTGVVRRSPSDV